MKCSTLRNVWHFFFIFGKSCTFAEKYARMKKSYLLYLLPVALSACGGEGNDSNKASLKGEIKALGNDTIYVYGVDRLYDRMDTLVVTNDKFSATLPVDTLVATILQFSDGTEYPLYLDKGNKIRIKGSAAELNFLQISGNTPNEELTAFNQELKGLGKPSEKALEEKAQSFINQHPSSLVSIHLLEKRFVQKAQPDFALIKTIIERMTGDLKDRPYIDGLSKLIEEEEKLDVGKTLPYFRLKNAEGKDITRTNFKDQYLLIQFWASWDSVSLEKNAMFRRIYKKEQKNKNFALLGISLDMNKGVWKETIEKDTLKWEQVCDFAGWNAEVVKLFAIQAIPANLLISPTGRIEGKGLDEEAIEQKLKEIEQKEKEKKERARQATRNATRR